MATTPPVLTPKRKRNDAASNEGDASPIHTEFRFEVSSSLLTDGNSSPRTKVAHKFGGLALADGGGGVPAHGRFAAPATTQKMDVVVDDDDDDDKVKMRKRRKPPPAPFAAPALPLRTQPGIEVPETPEAPKAQQPAVDATEPIKRDPLPQPNLDGLPHKPNKPSSLQPLATDPADAVPSSDTPSKVLQEPYPSFNRPIETSDSHNRKRTGTPPLVAGTTRAGKDSTDQSGDSKEVDVVDPIRAALTWHEDEITVYDPEDADDDGEGINGIGFKPTAAIAHARTMKRRQQLAEYKKREEREARSRRSQRRRGSPEMTRLERKESMRKVRFTEAEPKTMITI